MSTKHTMHRTVALAIVAVWAGGCSAAGGGDSVEYEELQARDSEAVVSNPVDAGATLRVTASALNLRAGGGTSYKVLDVLYQNDQVKVVERSGQNGWIHVEAPSGTIGWASAKYLQFVSAGSSGGTSSGGGATCDPSRALNAVGPYQKALHDSIAWAEGTRNYSNDGYDVMFSFRLMSSCSSHPNQCISFGSTCSTAAGRYQFLTTTWNGAKSALQLSSFEPESQERAGQYLVNNVRHVTVPQDRALTAAEFSNAMSKLSYEWASLPPGRYGQPTKTQSQMWSFYSGVVDSVGASTSSDGPSSGSSCDYACADYNFSSGDCEVQSGYSWYCDGTCLMLVNFCN